MAIGAVANDIMRARLPHIEQGQCIGGNAHLRQSVRNRRRIGPRRLYRRDRREVIERVKRGTGGEGGPFGRLHPLYPPTLLVDEDEEVIAA